MNVIYLSVCATCKYSFAVLRLKFPSFINVTSHSSMIATDKKAI